MSDLPLASEFPAATRDEWRKLVESVLKGAPFEKRLVSKTYDGISIQPLYERAKDAKRVVGRPDGEPWAVLQRIDLRDPTVVAVRPRDGVLPGQLVANGA